VFINIANGPFRITAEEPRLRPATPVGEVLTWICVCLAGPGEQRLEVTVIESCSPNETEVGHIKQDHHQQ
jgi:hypothetical protein